MTIYVLRLAVANRKGVPTKVQLLGPFANEASARDWSSHPHAGGVCTLRMTVVDLEDDPVIRVEEARAVW